MAKAFFKNDHIYSLAIPGFEHPGIMVRPGKYVSGNYYLDSYELYGLTYVGDDVVVDPIEDLVYDYVELLTGADIEPGVPNGLATLDATGKLTVAQLPQLAISDTFVVADQAARLALTAQTGDIAVQTDTALTYILVADPATDNANWKQIAPTSLNGSGTAGQIPLWLNSTTLTSDAGLTYVGGVFRVASAGGAGAGTIYLGTGGTGSTAAISGGGGAWGDGVVLSGTGTVTYSSSFAATVWFGAIASGSTLGSVVAPAYFGAASGVPLRWTSDTSAMSSADTSLSRISPGVVGVGTGAAGNTDGQISAGGGGRFLGSGTAGYHLLAGTTGTAYLYVTTAGGVYSRPGIKANSIGTFSWSSTTDEYQAADTGLSRISAGVLGVGTGAQGSIAGSLATNDVFSLSRTLTGSVVFYNGGNWTSGSSYDASITRVGIGALNVGSVLGIGCSTHPLASLRVDQPTTGVGVVSVSGTTVTGTNTVFTNTFKVGDTITVTTTSGSETKAISVIVSDTELTTAAFAGTASFVEYTLVGGTRFSVYGNGNVSVPGQITASVLSASNNSTATWFALGTQANTFFAAGSNAGTLHNQYRFAATYTDFGLGGTGVLGWTQTYGGGYSENFDVALARSSAGVLKVTNGSTGIGALLSSVKVTPNTGTVAPAVTDSRTVYTNEGSSGITTVTLPTAVAGLQYVGMVQANQTLTITAATGDTIRVSTSVTATGGSVTSNVIGSVIRLTAINATEWFGEITGTWNF